METRNTCECEHEFVLVLNGITDLSSQDEDSLYNVGCGDATISLRAGRIFMTFARVAPSLKEAILSAIRDVKKAAIGATVLRVDNCNLVTQSDIARRINRTRQQVHQYIRGTRGPGGFPSPACDLADGAPLWLWCEVSYWLCQNGVVKEDVVREAQDVAMINAILDFVHQQQSDPPLFEEVYRLVTGAPDACPA